MCSNPSLESVATSSVDHKCHHAGWIDALCKAYRDIPSSVVNVLKKSHPMHTMVLLCREPDWLVKDLQGP